MKLSISKPVELHSASYPKFNFAMHPVRIPACFLKPDDRSFDLCNCLMMSMLIDCFMLKFRVLVVHNYTDAPNKCSWSILANSFRYSSR